LSIVAANFLMNFQFSTCKSSPVRIDFHSSVTIFEQMDSI
jgi:hypothetical protein